MAETKKDAVAALEKAFGRKPTRSNTRGAADCLTKDRDALLGVLRLPRRALEALANDEPH